MRKKLLQVAVLLTFAFSGWQVAPAKEVTLACDNFKVTMNPDSTLKFIYDEQGEVLVRGDLVQRAKRRKHKTDWMLELQETVYTVDEGKRRLVPLNKVSQKGDTLIFTNDKEPAIKAVFKTANKKDYYVMQLLEVGAPAGEHVTTLLFQIWGKLQALPLNSELTMRSGEFRFGHLFDRTVGQDYGVKRELGAFALWRSQGKAQDDETLYKIWVNEKLPHPNIKDEWTIARAKKWVTDYIEKFHDFTEIYVTGESIDELRQLIDFASQEKIKNIYLHINTWGARYHPTDRDTYELNPKLFPNGHADFKAMCDYAKARDVGVEIRTLSHSISLHNPVFVGDKPDKRLSHYWRGHLAKDASAGAKEFVIKSDKTLPTFHGSPVNARLFTDFGVVGDEVFKFDKHTQNKDGTITIKLANQRGKPIRGYGPTKAVAHKAGTPVRLLIGTYKEKVTADHDSTLLEEVAQRYADFNNEMGLNNSNFDGLMLYVTNTHLGQTRFPGLVYSKLDHPAICRTSSGPPKWGFFEQRFHSTRKALGYDQQGLYPKRMQVRVGVHQDHWAAPNPYACSYAIVPHAVNRNYACSIQEQDGFHNVRVATLKQFALTDRYMKEIRQWRRWGPQLPAKVKKRIFNAYRRAKGAYPEQEEHFALLAAGGKLAVTPFTPMRREKYDRGWSFIQEHGPVFTYQYIQPNTPGLQKSNNPYHAQTPHFTLRVMKDFNRQQRTGDVPKQTLTWQQRRDLALEEEKLKDDNIKIHREVQGELIGKVSYDVMIPGSGKKLHTGKMRVKHEGEAVRVSYDNKANKEILFDFNQTKGGDLISYNVKSSLYRAGGLGVTITGDGSGAMFVIRVRGAGTRDYTIPLDFTGKRYIEIPDPQVSWSQKGWPITSAWKRWRSYTVKQIIAGFGTVPPKTAASVLIEDIRFLPEKSAALVNPVVHFGDGTFTIKGEIPSDHYLWYTGGDKIGVYDLNWNKLSELPVELDNAVVPAGESTVKITHQASKGNPWVECSFLVYDKPAHVFDLKE